MGNLKIIYLKSSDFMNRTRELQAMIEGVHTCYHCGNTGKLRYIEKVGWRVFLEDREINNNNCYEKIDYNSLVESEYWFIFECPVCNKPVLISEYKWVPENSTISKIEYPSVAIPKEGVPKEIYTAFESAIKTKGIDYAICLLSLRRVLEMICKDKGAEGNTLEKKIKDLVNKNIFTSTIDDACWIIRQLGNEAAHADKIEVYQNDVEQVIEYISVIIKYLYSIPCQVEIMRKKIEQRKKAE